MSEIEQFGVSLGIEDLRTQVALELAAGLSSPDSIKQRYKISDEKWEQLRSNKLFRNMVAEAVKELQGDLNAKRRIQLKAAMAVEDNLLDLVRMASDDSIPASSRIDAHKHLSDLAEVGSRAARHQDSGPAREGFSLVINFPGGEQMSVSPGPKPIEGTAEKVG